MEYRKNIASIDPPLIILQSELSFGLSFELPDYPRFRSRPRVSAGIAKGRQMHATLNF